MRTIALFGGLLALIFSSCQREFSDLEVSPQEDAMVKNKKAGLVLDKFGEAFRENVSRSASGKIYPSYFGGMYISESDEPVVLTTDMTKANSLRQIAGEDEVEVRQCTYSYQELLDLDDYIRKCLEEQSQLFDEIGVCCFGIYESRNCLEVAIVKATPEKINLFRSRIVDSPMLTFRSDSSYMSVEYDKELVDAPVMSVNAKIEPAYKLFPGLHLFGKGRLPVVISFRMESFGAKGFVTSGHVAQIAGGVGTYLTVNGDTVARILGIDMGIDAAFCILGAKGGSTVSDKLSNTIYLKPSMRIPHERLRVELGTLSRGIIQRPKVAVRYEGEDRVIRTIYTAAEADYGSFMGHSGTVVFDDRGIFGIHVGASVETRFSYFNHMEGILFYLNGALY